MDIQRWLRNSAVQIRHNGVDGLTDSVRPIYHKILAQGNRFKQDGVNIYEHDWDLFIVLDACRVDLMQEVADDYDFITAVDSFYSVDSATAEWMERTFVPEHAAKMRETVYICGNPFSAEKLRPEAFDRLDEVWETDWENIGTVAPRDITDRTIEAFREEDPDRVIAHYMQPHCPFIPSPELMAAKNKGQWGDQDSRDVWEQLRAGDLSLDSVWDGYRANLELVLEDIELLLENVDADRVLVSSDHGNAIGAWNVYGHPPRMPMASLREVPLIETTGTDKHTYSVDRNESETASEISRKEQLRALGYAE